MGVPAFFRWLSRKYPSIVVHCVEEKNKVVDGQTIPNDCSKPNPNNVEFDNLYLDMNGIIHPCCHPENKAAPKNEDEMMVAIFEYIDRLFNIIRPRKLLYMAIDGVAPRAKMNQQRSRRFRASKETAEKVDEIRLTRERLMRDGCTLPPEKPKEEHFDSNCITPGTPFMDRLAKCLHYYIHERLNTDPGWRNIEVILSDANVPGEGEHKIMDYIRRQRASPNHDPNTHHCLCGADADLIMLGLATHEPSFTIIREEFKPNQPRPCELCGQIGHEMKECRGLGKIKEGEFDELEKPVGSETDFIFIRLNVLREYLEKELAMHSVPFKYDFERCIDDWVFMCFFVGNDFLPHLPSLEIREGAIDRLVRLYKSAVTKTGGYLTESGLVNASRVQLIMTELGEAEDEIFKRRQENELAFKSREKAKKKRIKMGMGDRPAWIPAGLYEPKPITKNPTPIHNARQEARDMRMQGMQNESPQNKEAAEALKAMLKRDGDETGEPKGEKRKKDDESEEEEEPHDEVRLWEDGWKERYYASKFEVSEDNVEFRHKVAAAYTLGLCWVLRYYYQGCASWKWFFPYHYAPFASDFVNVGDVCTDFEKGTKPFNPMEQLMGVFPAASRKHVPAAMAELMIDPESTIIDFYPDDFKVDLNGKKWAWQGVALLPFVDERRLLDALTEAYKTLTAEEQKRNVRGDDVMFVRKDHPGYDFLLGLYESNNYEQEFDLNSEYFGGVSGKILLSEDSVGPMETLHSPVIGLDPIPDNAVVCVKFRDPQFEEDFLFPAKRLPGAKEPKRVLKPGELSRMENQRWRPQVGMAPARQRAHVDSSGFRKLDRGLGWNSPYSSVAPPRDMYSRGGRFSSPRTPYGSRGRGGGQWQQYKPSGNVLPKWTPGGSSQTPNPKGSSGYRGPSDSYGGGGGDYGGGYGSYGGGGAHQRSYSAPSRDSGDYYGGGRGGGSGSYQAQGSYQYGGSAGGGGYQYQGQTGVDWRSSGSQSSGGYQSQYQGQQSGGYQGSSSSSSYQGSRYPAPGGYQSSRYQAPGASQQQQSQGSYWQ